MLRSVQAKGRERRSEPDDQEEQENGGCALARARPTVGHGSRRHRFDETEKRRLRGMGRVDPIAIDSRSVLFHELPSRTTRELRIDEHELWCDWFVAIRSHRQLFGRLDAARVPELVAGA